MYAWKCWFDTRSRFVTLLVLCAVLLALSVVPAALVHTAHGWVLVRGGTPSRVARVWGIAAGSGLVVWGTFVMSLVGLVLGSSGMPGDCNKETIYFLLTRPRRRGYFVWTGFAVGAGETLAITSLGVLAAFLMLVYLTGRVYTWRFFGVIPIFGVGTLVVYGQTFLLGILSRSTQDGITYSLGLFLAEVSLPVAVNRFWNVHAPSFLQLMADPRWLFGHGVHFPIYGVLGWSLVALSCPVVAQWVFARIQL